MFYDILERKNAFLGYKTACSNSGKIEIFAKGQFWSNFVAILVQNWPFFHVLFLGNIGQEKVFYDILERKNAFVGYKNNKFKKSKKWDFCKGLTHGFGLKLAIFPSFFF